MAEQMLPMEQALKSVMPWEVDGFMMNLSPASQVEELRGQHCWALTALLSLQVELVQSWTAPNVWPVSWLISLAVSKIKTR